MGKLQSRMIIGNHIFPVIITSNDKVKKALIGRLLHGASTHSHHEHQLHAAHL